MIIIKTVSSRQSDLGHQMKEHVEAGLARVLPHDVGGRQVEQCGAELRADGVEEHRLAASLWSH